MFIGDAAIASKTMAMPRWLCHDGYATMAMPRWLCKTMAMPRWLCKTMAMQNDGYATMAMQKPITSPDAGYTWCRLPKCTFEKQMRPRARESFWSYKKCTQKIFKFTTTVMNVWCNFKVWINWKISNKFNIILIFKFDINVSKGLLAEQCNNRGSGFQLPQRQWGQHAAICFNYITRQWGQHALICLNWITLQRGWLM